MAIAPFIIEWAPSIPFSTPSAWKRSKSSLMTLGGIFRNISYSQLPGNSREILVRISGLKKMYLVKARTGQMLGFFGLD